MQNTLLIILFWVFLIIATFIVVDKFQGEVTIYPVITKETGVTPASRIGFKVFPTSQTVVFWEFGSDQIFALEKCAVRDKLHWSCQFEGKPSSMVTMNERDLKGFSNDVPGMRYASAWEWWRLHVRFGAK